MNCHFCHFVLKRKERIKENVRSKERESETSFCCCCLSVQDLLCLSLHFGLKRNLPYFLLRSLRVCLLWLPLQSIWLWLGLSSMTVTEQARFQLHYDFLICSLASLSLAMQMSVSQLTTPSLCSQSLPSAFPTQENRKE